jgi:basic membrane protein A and related proteins
MVWKKPFYSTDLSVGVKILSGAGIFIFACWKVLRPQNTACSFVCIQNCCTRFFYRSNTMKRFIARLAGCAVCIAAVTAGFSGCRGKTETAQVSAEQNSSDSFIVGFVFDGYINDGGWCYEQNRGRVAAEAAGIKTIYKENVPATQECVKVIDDLINQGAKVIVGTTFGFMDYMLKAAAAHPDVIFLHCGGYKNSANLYTYLGRQYQSRFLCGLIAGSETKTGKLGYIAAFSIPEVVRGINAYTLGAQIANPDVQVIVRWTHTWYDPSIEKEAGKSLLDEGCDILTEHESTAASLEPAEENGLMTIGYTTDMSKTLPKSYLTSSGYNWASFFVPAFKAMKAGTWEKANFWGGLETGVPVLPSYSDRVTDAGKQLVSEYTGKITGGSYKVFQGPVYDQEGKIRIPEGTAAGDGDLLSMNYFVRGVVGKVE